MSCCHINSAIHEATRLQNGLQKLFLPLNSIHSQWKFFHSTGIISGKAYEAMKPAALWICTTRLPTISCWGGALVYTPLDIPASLEIPTPGHTKLLTELFLALPGIIPVEWKKSLKPWMGESGGFVNHAVNSDQESGVLQCWKWLPWWI